MSKNWPNDPRISCKSFCSMTNFIESDFNLEEEEFEKAFKRDKVVELRLLNIYIFPNFHVFKNNLLSEGKYSN